ncbi:16S rRNA (cytidine(1402)-2'-O)-methyltransferase [Streptococcus sp. E17BB]|uniref:16S rRNA (cytidine(1402)-2'-O)-methyltransferase n=1 Tax=Streptococcus sp. E17BB TaxID=3278714 RepID=UPI00359D4F16
MRIQRSFKDNSGAGTLYLVPTPIGNLEDMTFRAVEVLKNVDLIAAEDTRNTGLLLKHFGITTRQTSFHEHNAVEKIPVLIDLLVSGQSLAQVSDAGMPSISDPGHDLVQAALAQEVPVVALPGASAGLTALIASGLMPQPHVFYGFLPRKSGQQLAFFEEKKHYPETQIFYESPHRLVATLTNVLSVYGDRQVVVVRELTKLYEEYQRGMVSEAIAYLTEHPAKGECLILVAGYEQSQHKPDELTDQTIIDLVAQAIAQGQKPNAAIKDVAKRLKLNRQAVYKLYHAAN